MNRRQFFGALAGGAVVSKMPAPADAQPSALVRLMQAAYHFPQTARQPHPTTLVTSGWAAVSDERHLYVSRSVQAADRLFDLHRAISGKEKTDA